MARLLRQNARLLGRAYTTGHLYSLGWYPGATHNPATGHRVWGEVYEIINDLILSELDQYEGIQHRPHDDYARREVPVWLVGSGLVPTQVRCQMYVYCQDTTGLSLIESGDFLRP